MTNPATVATIQAASRDATLSVTREQGLDLWRQMILIRRFEERAEQAYTEGKIGGFMHLYIGEEAIAVGALAGLNPDDDVVTHYRDHGYALARALAPNALMAELYGKATGICKGKGGSMHFADPQKHFWGCYAIVGGHIPLAVGLAFAAQYQNQSRVAVAIFGDGATNIGMFHESLNMAKVWNVPLIILVENNQYGMGTAVHRASAVPDMITKALAYNIPAVQVDGNDVLAMRDVMMHAAQNARCGEGPQFIEAHTYRWRGHSMGDPQRYRSKDEVEKMKTRDPIARFENRLRESARATQDDFARIRAEVERVVAESIEFAETSPFPEPSELYTDVFAPEVVNG